jgi:hypothetical protein
MKEDRIGSPITVGEITVIPLEKVSLYHVNTKEGFTMYFSKEPVGIAISSPQRKWAIDITDGKEVPIESYYEQFNNLQQILDNL